jgi:FMN phosphatase YigB (HAD superfamily)
MAHRNPGRDMNVTLLKRDIEEVCIVSFDFFDTLSYRPFLESDHALEYLEAIHCVPGWLQARKKAEAHSIHSSGLNCVPIAKFYEFVPEPWRFMEKIEIDFEFQIIRANPEMLEIFEFAKSLGKTIIIVSDTYYDKSTMKSILSKCGFYDYHTLYASSEYGETKSCGTLFDRVLRDFGQQNATSILHIGDNQHSDVAVPRSKGIKVFHYPKLSGEFLSNPRFQGCAKYWAEKNSKDRKEVVFRSYHLGALALLFKKGTFDSLDLISEMFLYAFPFLLMYFNDFIYEAASEAQSKHLAFIARDGYLMKRLFDCTHNQDGAFNSQYVYASRFLTKAINLDLCNLKESDASSIIGYYCENHPDIASLFGSLDFNHANHSAILETYTKNKALFEVHAHDYKLVYSEYLASLSLRDQNVLCIDWGGINLSAQRFLANFVKQASGIYCNVCSSTELKIKNFIDQLLPSYRIVEIFITSPENPICGVRKAADSFVPVYKEASEENAKKSHVDEHFALTMEVYNEFHSPEFRHNTLPVLKFMEIYEYIARCLSPLQITELGSAKNCESVAHNKNDFENVWIKIRKCGRKNAKIRFWQFWRK